MKSYRFKILKELDWKLILNIFAIFGFGILMLTSATHANQIGNYKQIIKQILAFVLGLILIIGMLFIDYNTLGENFKFFYIASIVLLIAVWIPGLGTVQEGSRRWIKLGPLYLQTSELVKLTFIVSYAKIVERKRGKLNTIKEVIPVILYAMPVLVLMLLEPDLGGTIVFGCIMLGMLFMAGLNVKIIKNAFLVLIVSLPLIYAVMAPHQRVRIEAFLHPDDLSYKGNYQVVQSLIAIGSGGAYGKGLYNGTQNNSGFLPVQESDFIFAVIGEELGLVGMCIIIALYMMFIIRMISMAGESKDFYGTLIIIGVMSMFAYQIIQNIGMNMALIPVTGITLPLISYGGSSLLSSLASLGLVINVGMRKRKINF
ncbi:FtsW/RodA/SpoVE family cell cycle protein [Romboutsia sedimentorum]|uniref:FtsW/RodA/SpoVE family cell cycle protein n=1 Tax=Romboutsia sedimentorum TaxID=1368474 RepID=UPI0024DE8D81|nr:FtsW/RodA/SpoVE family cell cycle protein [Romboutsia sedimentorum]MDK2586389.1 FtsW/RodA/SpoVE family cell cycle protein [Romboutsia sedimentorum]